MRRLILKMFALSIALANFTSAQIDNLSDCLPLAVGNKWNYTYTTKQVGYFSHFSSTESGLIEFQVISKSEQPNGYVTWEIKQKKNATRDTYGIPVQSVKDSTAITIIESLELNHELTSSTASDPLSIFPFKTGAPDTSKFFRYKEYSTEGDIFLRIIFPDKDNPTLSRYNYEFMLRKDVGILKLIFKHSYIGGMRSSEYYISKFNNQIINSVEGGKSIDTKFSLSQNYPNPFNPSTTIDYQLPTSGFVTLKVYDLLGREVATLVNEYKQPGTYNSKLNTQNFQLPSGVYFYRLQVGSYSQTKKLILMK